MYLPDYQTEEQALGSIFSKLKKVVTQPVKFLAKETTKVATGLTKAVGIKPGTILGKAIIKPVEFAGKAAVKVTDVASNIALKPVDIVSKAASAVAKPVETLFSPPPPPPTPVPAPAVEQAIQQAYAPVASLPNAALLPSTPAPPPTFFPGLNPPAASGFMPGGGASTFFDQPSSDFTPSGAPAAAPTETPQWLIPVAAGAALLLFLKAKSSPRRGRRR